jgi:hypothetical protein
VPLDAGGVFVLNKGSNKNVGTFKNFGAFCKFRLKIIFISILLN